mmetsp:Transcript_19884/g.35477  ORF Transcript_19884/g.35477 Transcript_19884/m.35477 type:complete len:288 (-) Transcript_19884:144-1007(-)
MSDQATRQRILTAVAQRVKVRHDVHGQYVDCSTGKYVGLVWNPWGKRISIYFPDGTGYKSVKVGEYRQGNPSMIVATEEFGPEGKRTGEMRGEVSLDQKGSKVIVWEGNEGLKGNRWAMEAGSMPFTSLEEWQELCKDKYLKVSDILKMKAGETIEVVSFDRNWGDVALDEDRNPPGVPTDPKHFFRENKATYTHSGADLRGTVKWTWDPEKDYDFEFDLEYKSKCWYPLKNSCFPTVTLTMSRFSPEHEGRHYSTYPPSTHVGWRGPWMPWSALADLPKVTWSGCD